jgi:hypothetical protein
MYSQNKHTITTTPAEQGKIRSVVQLLQCPRPVGFSLSRPAKTPRTPFFPYCSQMYELRCHHCVARCCQYMHRLRGAKPDHAVAPGPKSACHDPLTALTAVLSRLELQAVTSQSNESYTSHPFCTTSQPLYIPVSTRYTHKLSRQVSHRSCPNATSAPTFRPTNQPPSLLQDSGITRTFRVALATLNTL